ncbi:hypothetical protein K432DRAFT_381237 [Lepidopterella palustris CBS 459.81]|uniref:Uncharacterized protein n=1 Tax=Lepidopterella palustris CBS 459.81 TaxID=1314670 RepID=A0A8E2ECX1_9PEZI|nr:hypothetical protein K432DRAFT_381237 [Lepidopterella palustris CBS 459.81]
MAPTTDATNIWAQMNYAPPRGQCNYKQSLMSPRCPCLRFMLHPLKSNSTFDCDGCGHHASFHSMENRAEDEIRKRWEAEDRAKEAEAREAEPSRPRKRVRQIEGPGNTAAHGRLMIEAGERDIIGGAQDDEVMSSSTMESTTVLQRRMKPTSGKKSR